MGNTREDITVSGIFLAHTNTLSPGYATLEEKYHEQYKRLLETCPQPVITYMYYKKFSWHDICTEWVKCFKAFSLHWEKEPTIGLRI